VPCSLAKLKSIGAVLSDGLLPTGTGMYFFFLVPFSIINWGFYWEEIGFVLTAEMVFGSDLFVRFYS
jgi:hypothetical protein